MHIVTKTMPRVSALFERPAPSAHDRTLQPFDHVTILILDAAIHHTVMFGSAQAESG